MALDELERWGHPYAALGPAERSALSVWKARYELDSFLDLTGLGDGANRLVFIRLLTRNGRLGGSADGACHAAK